MISSGVKVFRYSSGVMSQSKLSRRTSSSDGEYSSKPTVRPE